MFPSPTLLGRIAGAMIADPDCCGTGTYELQLSGAAFVPATMVGFTQPTFDGYAAVGASDWVDGIDPFTGDRTITLLPPVGGFEFDVTGNTNLPQSVYGFRVFNVTNNETVGSAVLAEPLVIQQAPSTFFINAATLRLNPAMVS